MKSLELDEMKNLKVNMKVFNSLHPDLRAICRRLGCLDQSMNAPAAAKKIADAVVTSMMEPGDIAYVSRTSQTTVAGAFTEICAHSLFKNNSLAICADDIRTLPDRRCRSCFDCGGYVIVIDPTIVNCDSNQFDMIEYYLVQELSAHGCKQIWEDLQNSGKGRGTTGNHGTAKLKARTSDTSSKYIGNQLHGSSNQTKGTKSTLVAVNVIRQGAQRIQTNRLLNRGDPELKAQIALADSIKRNVRNLLTTDNALGCCKIHKYKIPID